MPQKLSPRLSAIVEALPLQAGMRVLEIGCGPGAAARAVVQRIGNGHVLAIDRSARAIAQAKRGSAAELAAGHLEIRQAAAEDLVLEAGEEAYDLAFAVRCGAFDGRDAVAAGRALARVRKMLHSKGRLYIDGGSPLREVALDPR